MPWHDGDSVPWNGLGDVVVTVALANHRIAVAKLVESCFGKEVFPEYTTLVLWKKGKSHPRHKDNGYVSDNNILKNRAYTSITYLNTDFTGGETFVSTEHGVDYISEPKVGSVVIFPSDESAEHGVNEVTSGMRVTMPIWFCLDKNDSEDVRYKR